MGGLSMSERERRLEESLNNIEADIKHKEYEIRFLKREWDLVYSKLLAERLKNMGAL